MTERVKDQPFDERAALGELERFRREIERYRRQREAVHQEFDLFVSSFPSPESVFPPERPEVTPATRVQVDGTSSRPKVAAAPPPPPAPSPAAGQRRTHAGVPPAPPSPPPFAPPRPPAASTAAPVQTPRARDDAAGTVRKDIAGPRRSRALALMLLVLLAIVAGIWTWNVRRGGSGQAASGAPRVTQAPPAETTPRPAETAPAAAATSESVLTTVRRAWVRVIADGERVVERELPADTRVPFNAEKTIIVRTGDAGAVRLSIRGADQGALGRDGQVVTRTFDVPAKTPR